ncbi:MAG: 3-isopropylmalate dehydratase large subunit [Rhodospirillaceae bacterium]|nr:3-isopropylmalate dehydratase large subunit [Rhodospirillaceae bacterium]
MTRPRTLFRKIWDAHAVAEGEGRTLLAVDRHFVHEGSFHAFDAVQRRGLTVRRPDLTIAIADHYVPTRDRGRPIADAEIRTMVDLLAANAAREGIRLFGPDDPRQGIVHVVGPELGLTLPGTVIVCGDSHTATHGAFGAYAFGIGASEVAHVLATQTLWQARPKTMRVTVDGALGPGVAAKDLILALIGCIGTGGATGHVVEYAGSAVRGLSMDGRMTVCNMSIEAGARAGLIAPDDTTFAWLAGRPAAPQGDLWPQAVAAWQALASDPGAVFDREVRLAAAGIAPTVTWGTSPEDALPIDAVVPDPHAVADPARRTAMERALAYMDLRPGTPLAGIAVDRVFIGSCTNARLGDLRAAAAVLEGRRARVPGLVVPGSTTVKRQAEAEGLDRIFTEAGLDWRDSGCSMCVAMNGDVAAAGERCASSTNRNFPGRQGRSVRTHLMSPAMVAAAAVTGRLTDVRALAPAGVA